MCRGAREKMKSTAYCASVPWNYADPYQHQRCNHAPGGGADFRPRSRIAVRRQRVRNLEDIQREALSIFAALRAARAFRGRDRLEAAVVEIQNARRNPADAAPRRMPYSTRGDSRHRRVGSGYRDLY